MPSLYAKLISHTIHSGSLTLPMAGIGTYKMKQAAILSAARKGFVLFDTAKVYETEEAVGDMIQEIGREKLIIITKLARAHLLSLKTLRDSVEDSITKLGSIPDVFLIHGPYHDVPIIAVARELEAMKQEGIIKAWGVSNFENEHLDFLLQHNLKPAMNQVEYHPFFQRHELLRFCKQHDIIMQAYRPLVRGKVLEHPTIQKFAQKYKVDPAVIIYNWLIQQEIPFVTTVNSEVHQDILADAQRVALTAEEMAAIDALHDPAGRTCMKDDWDGPFTQEVRKAWRREFS
jgi:diketogulonate reductase-like aldo/keto reductase